jgi:hypothetical protein
MASRRKGQKKPKNPAQPETARVKFLRPREWKGMLLGPGKNPKKGKFDSSYVALPFRWARHFVRVGDAEWHPEDVPPPPKPEEEAKPEAEDVKKADESDGAPESDA